MKTAFQFHECARQGLQAWIDDLSAREPNGRHLARIIASDIRQRLEMFGTKLPNLMLAPNCRPPLYWWQYFPGNWISFVVRETGVWWWRTRRVIVYSVGEPPPDRLVASSPRS